MSKDHQITRQNDEVTDIVSSTHTPVVGASSQALAADLKKRLGWFGKLTTSQEERIANRSAYIEAIRSELRSKTEIMLHENRLDVDYSKKIKQAGHLVRVTKIEEFIFNAEAATEFRLNEDLNRIEDAFSSQYMEKLRQRNEEKSSGKITDAVYDHLVKSLWDRFQAPLDNAAGRMKAIIDNHVEHVRSTLRSMTQESDRK